ncbi:hypothetical protein F4809DRAFT_623405, partial [Biscogniauxia mediterranea]
MGEFKYPASPPFVFFSCIDWLFFVVVWMEGGKENEKREQKRMRDGRKTWNYSCWRERFSPRRELDCFYQSCGGLKKKKKGWGGGFTINTSPPYSVRLYCWIINFLSFFSSPVYIQVSTAMEFCRGCFGWLVVFFFFSLFFFILSLTL